MTHHPKYSVVVPVYNRPQELDELLESLVSQSYKNFEVLIVDDGSSETSQHVFEKYADKLALRYFYKPNSGPGPSRNHGFSEAMGDFFVVFDSDCVLPDTYFKEVEEFMAHQHCDAWGGPDRGRSDFTPLQQAMAYTMSSFLTTGGIRGGKRKMTGFQPRSFNMGISRAVFLATGGYRFDRFAEDIELSIRMKKAGFKVCYIDSAYVFHKRRTTFMAFFRQVSNFGKGRAMVGKVHRGEAKLTHWMPTLLILGLIISVITLPLYPTIGGMACGAYLLYFFLIGFSALMKSGKLNVAFLSMPAAFIQISGYGIGFLRTVISYRLK